MEKPTPRFAPDLAALVPLLASVRARKLARLNGGVADQARAEDATPALTTGSRGKANA